MPSNSASLASLPRSQTSASATSASGDLCGEACLALPRLLRFLGRSSSGSILSKKRAPFCARRRVRGQRHARRGQRRPYSTRRHEHRPQRRAHEDAEHAAPLDGSAPSHQLLAPVAAICNVRIWIADGIPAARCTPAAHLLQRHRGKCSCKRSSQTRRGSCEKGPARAASPCVVALLIQARPIKRRSRMLNVRKFSATPVAARMRIVTASTA